MSEVYEVMLSHEGHPDCVCTDGNAHRRDVCQMCNSPIPPPGGPVYPLSDDERSE